MLRGFVYLQGFSSMNLANMISCAAALTLALGAGSASATSSSSSSSSSAGSKTSSSHASGSDNTKQSTPITADWNSCLTGAKCQSLISDLLHLKSSSQSLADSSHSSGGTSSSGGSTSSEGASSSGGTSSGGTSSSGDTTSSGDTASTGTDLGGTTTVVDTDPLTTGSTVTSTVPEPSTYALLIGGLAVLLLAARRARKVS